MTKIHKTHELCQLALMLKLQEDLAEETDVDAGTSTSSSISEATSSVSCARLN